MAILAMPRGEPKELRNVLKFSPPVSEPGVGKNRPKILRRDLPAPSAVPQPAPIFRLIRHSPFFALHGIHPSGRMLRFVSNGTKPDWAGRGPGAPADTEG